MEFMRGGSFPFRPKAGRASPDFSRQLTRLSRRCLQSSQRLAQAAASSSGRAVACSVLGSAGLGAAALCLAPAAGLTPDGDASRPRRASGADALSKFGNPQRRATDTILLLNVLMFSAQWLSKDAVTVMGMKINELILAGQLWRFITPAFLHGSLAHLAINCLSLHNLGPSMEALSGGARFIAVYGISTVISTGFSVARNPTPSLGASGAIFGLGAALAVFHWRNREHLSSSSAVLKSLGFNLLINAALIVFNRRLDHWGHLGGLVGGALAAWLLGPRLVRREDGRLVDRPPLPVLAWKAPGPAPPPPVQPGVGQIIIGSAGAGGAAAVDAVVKKGKKGRKDPPGRPQPPSAAK